MPKYRLTLLSADGVRQRDVEAPSPEDARREAAKSGEPLLALKALSGAAPRRDGGFPLRLFSRELVSLLEAGLNTVEALRILREKADRPTLATSLRAIEQSLAAGHPLSAALAALPQHFPPLFVAVVSSSEQTGQLAHALRRYLEHETRLAALKKQLVSALLYPALVLVVGFLVVLFMLCFVIPRFAKLLASASSELSMSAQAMLSWSNLLEQHGNLLAMGATATAGAIAWGLGQASWRAHCLRVIYRWPKIGAWRQLFELTRFYSAFGLVLEGGVPVPDALRLVGTLLGADRAAALAQSQADLAAGQPLSTVLARHGLTTVVAEHLRRIGEHTGEIGQMCGHIVRFQDEALTRMHEVITQVFGPLVMLAVGLVVGGLVVMLYMPIFELAGGLGT